MQDDDMIEHSAIIERLSLRRSKTAVRERKAVHVDAADGSNESLVAR
jgi:hypothetical protein